VRPKDLLPSPPPFVPLPRFMLESEGEDLGNPVSERELEELEGRYGSWAARMANAFAPDVKAAERIAKGLSERILGRF